jgi:DNA gyrase/topoisomerase IV subunit A
MQLGGPKVTLVGAGVLGQAEDALLVSHSGRTARLAAADLPLVARDRKGHPALKLEATDSLVRLIVLPT